MAVGYFFSKFMIFNYTNLVRMREELFKMHKFLISLLFIFCFVPELHSEMKFTSYTVQDKLSHNIVYDVEKDSTGLMWFATRIGVDSYDGKNFKHYDLVTEQSIYPESNSGRTLFVDTSGVLWVGSDKGLLKYNPDLDLFVPFLLQEGFQMRGGIVSIYMDADGYLWLGGYHQIYVVDPIKHTMIHIFDNCDYVRQITRYDDKNVIYVSNSGCSFINNDDYSEIQILNQIMPQKSGPLSIVSTVFRDKDDNFWFASQDYGVFVTDYNLNLKRRISSLDFIKKSETLVKRIFYITEDDIGILTDGEGVFILGKNYEIKDHYVYKDDDPGSLNTNALSDIYIDDSHRIWITTIGGGINLYDPNLLPFDHIIHQAKNENSIKNDKGNAILYLKPDEIWFGTKEGISIWNKPKGTWRYLSANVKENGRQYKKIVQAIENISNEEIWIGTYGGGIDIYNLKTKSLLPLEKMYRKSKGMNLDYVSEITCDSKGNVWLGSLRNPLIRFDPRSGEFYTYPITNIFSVFEAKNGNIYVGTRSGFVVIDKNDEFIRFDKNSKIGLSSNYITCFHETDDGMILIGTEGGGINIFNPGNNTNTIISKQNGLMSNIINCILQGTENTYWASTSNGLSVINLKNGKIVNYGLSDGLEVLSFTRENGVRLEDGELIFGGYEGYVKFDPSQIVQKKIPVKLKLLDLKVSNISTSIGGEKSPLVKHIDKTEKVVLSYLQNSFTIDFVGINYTNPDQNQYSWMLEGFDDEWTPWTNNLSATYTNIGMGHYEFKLRASNPYGLSDSRSLELIVRSPWWLSFWAFLFYILVFSAVSFFIFYFIRIKYKERQSTEKIRFFTNIAHDIKTPLTLIHTPLQKIMEDDSLKAENRHTIELAIHNAEKIKSIANQLLDFQKTDLKKMELNLEESNFIRHIKEICKSFNPLIEKKNIKFQLLTEIPVLEFYYDRKIIEKIVNNLLSNAIKYTNEGGNVNVKIKVQGKHCILKVTDDGIGIPEAQKQEIFKRYFRASNAVNSIEVGCGVGLMLVKQLVELLGGEISFTSKENKGTIFTVKLKIVLHPENQISRKSKYISVYEMDNKGKKGREDVDSEKTEDNDLPKLLIVEDNVELQIFLEESFKGKYSVTMAANGNEALEIVKKFDPDIIVSDVMMPGMDGKILCHTLKQRIETCHIPVILLTALSSSDHRAEGYEVGADAYIEKPFDMKVLISRIENLLQIRKTLKGKFFKFDDSPNDIVYQNSLDQDFIAKANDLLEQEIENPEFDVETFSEEMNVSRPVLYRKIKALTGQSPHEFIIYAKLRHAVRLLRSNQMSIKEVAYASGFSNSKYFSTTFKKYFDLTPTEFLNKKEDVLIK